MSFPAETALDLLRRARKSGRLAHAYLISGATGSGKRLVTASIVGDLVGKPVTKWPPPAHPDVHVIEPESKSRRILTEQIRAMEHPLRLRPAIAAVKVAILVDADRLQPNAANAFLKTLEEPPGDTHIFLISEQPEMMLPTILSRCLQVPLRAPLNPEGATNDEQTLLTSAARCFSARKRTVGSLLVLSKQIQAHLAGRKDAIRKTLDAALKDEKSAWADSIDKDWLNRREDYYDAVADARYRAERERLLLLMCEWWAGTLRKVAGSDVAMPERDSLSIDEILTAIERLDALRDALGRNAQESLAFDAGLLGLATRV
jgi:DNA polymerase-3 subunit delta'